MAVQYGGRPHGLTKIEASQKGWRAVHALTALVKAIADIHDGRIDWSAYSAAKTAALKALEEMEVWLGRRIPDL